MTTRITREGLRTALELSDQVVVVVGEAGTGEEAIERARELSPNVVFMDVRMPGERVKYSLAE